MEKKLIVIFIFLLSLPITYVSYLSAHSMNKTTLRNATANAEQMTTNAGVTVDRYIADLKGSTLLPLYNTDVQYYMEQRYTDWDKNVSIGKFLDYLFHTKQEITAVYLVDSFDSAFFYKMVGINQLNTDDQLPRWKSMLKNVGTSPVLEGRHTIDVNLGDSREVFSVLRTVRSTSTLDDIGMIIFDIDINMFRDILKSVDSVTLGRSIIVDNKGKLVYASGDGSSSDQLQALLSHAGSSSGSYEYTRNGERYLTAYYVSSQTGWITAVDIPLSSILSGIKQNRMKQLVTNLLILSFALFVATLFSYALTRPLKSMIRLMKQVQHGNLDVWIHPRYNDEIGMLGTHFNRMIIRIRDLLSEVKQTEKRKQKADMRALQNQINPHFFYNTLESIRMLAESRDDTQIAKLTYLLGQQMRYSITRNDESVTVRQELEHVRNYFNLLQIRFPDKYSLLVDVPEDLMNLPILKLVFQPIVENAVFHGLEPKQGLGNVKITARYEEEYVLLRVDDDGVGMDAETLKHLNYSLINTASSSRFGIGLHNVNERIKLHYGESSGIQVWSRPGIGTCVTLRLKLDSTPSDTDLVLPIR
ncbi:cache domain-containing sensor histidine kinase [Paenibacillus stellifer]|uniref:cache domain-containing sensor histidine kinase n=1 Tax=Paenibacillus stellifer TaxID=169760 RepID=UPI001FE2325F|nr:sensor histidine kinase [Paenibacillus stellifer]